MSERVIIRSATVDHHGDYTSVEMLKGYVNAVNSKEKMRFLVNHRRDLPPLGYLDNAEIRQEDGVYHACVEPIKFAKRRFLECDSDFIIEETGGPLKLISRNEKAPNSLRISVDKNNFGDLKALNCTGKSLHELHNGEIELKLHMRKTLLPDPQLVVTLVNYGVIFSLVKPLLTKIGEKFAEDVADDIYKAGKAGVKKLISGLKETVRLTRLNMIPKDKTLLTIFEIPWDPYIELHIRSDDATKIEKGLQPRNLLLVHSKIGKFKQHFDISEIYFVLNAKDKWEFRYLITVAGQVVGTKIAYAKRDKLITRIDLSPTKAFSIGAEQVTFERRPISVLTETTQLRPEQGNNCKEK